MKRFLFITLFLIPILITTTTAAEMQVSNLGVRVIESEGTYTEFSWKVNIYSDESKPNCYINISFRDNEGYQIHLENAIISISSGSNHLTGQGMCKTNIWTQINEYMHK